MSVLVGSVTATSGAAILYVNRTGSPTPLHLTTHGNSADVYLGSGTVTASTNGIVVPKSSHIELTVPAGETVYCAGNGTDTVKWMAFN